MTGKGQPKEFARNILQMDTSGKNQEDERQPFISKVWSRFTARYESTSGSTPQEKSLVKGRAWGQVKKSVENKEVLIRHFTDDDEVADGSGGVSESSKKWSDLIYDIQEEFSLDECFILFVSLLAIGAFAFSFLFEQWSILDSLYFTTVLLTTVGYGDITPLSVGGKLFASLFALGGIVMFGLVLGVLGSQLVEAEMNNLENVKSVTSRALEAALTGDSHNGQSEKEKMAHSIQAGERTLSRSDSASSLEFKGSSFSGVDDPESRSLLPQHEDVTSDGNGKPRKIPGLSVIKRHLHFSLLIVMGVVLVIMALLDKWGWCDVIYFCVVTATTVGFGDISPSTQLGKGVAILLIPIVVGAMGYILGKVASSIVENRRVTITKKLWKIELKVEDIDVIDEGHDGQVSELEFIKFMLVAMKKVDGALINDLQKQFRQLDLTGDGQITKEDLKMKVTQKWSKASRKLELHEYKMRMLGQEALVAGTAFNAMALFPKTES